MFSPERAARAQELMRSMLILEGRPEPKVVAGLDVAYSRRRGTEIGVAVAVALEWGSWRIMACKVAVGPVCVPYIPGLLAFREMQVAAPALSALLGEVGEVDLVVVDGHGVAHPRGFGIASHVGVAFGLASIGVAKRKLVGVEVERGGRRYLIHGGAIVGVIVERGGRRLYVSPGHMVGVEEAGELVAEMLDDTLPEPTRRADAESKRAKRLVAPAGGLKVLNCPQRLAP